MAVVTNIESFRGVVRISVDGRRLAGVKSAFFQKLPLNVGDVIDEEEYLGRMAALQFPAAYEAALTMLDASEHTSGEIVSSLKRKGFVEAAALAAAERLKENRLIDDARYARRLAESKGGKAGAYAIRRKLRGKGLSEEHVELAMECVSEESQLSGARSAAEKLLGRYAGGDPRAVRAKLGQALARRGYGWDVINQAVESLLDGEDWYGD